MKKPNGCHNVRSSSLCTLLIFYSLEEGNKGRGRNCCETTRVRKGLRRAISNPTPPLPPLVVLIWTAVQLYCCRLCLSRYHIVPASYCCTAQNLPDTDVCCTGARICASARTQAGASRIRNASRTTRTIIHACQRELMYCCTCSTVLLLLLLLSSYCCMVSCI